MVSTGLIPGDWTPHGGHRGDTWGQEGTPPYLEGPWRGEWGGVLPSGTRAGTARRSIQKDTQESITIRVAGK